MGKKYLYIILTYVVMQLSVFIAAPLLMVAGVTFFDMDMISAQTWAGAIWVLISFIIGIVVMLLILRKSTPYTRVEKEEPMAIGPSITWGILGIFIAFAAQIIATIIETSLGIETSSENTEQILELIQQYSFVIIVVSVIGPIMEEIVFRKVIFGYFYNRFPFWASALISSLIFAIAHMELEHLIKYAAMGFTFAFLYVKTKRIIVPMISHMMMNTLVTLSALFVDPSELKQAVTSFISVIREVIS